jgi:hypothetical protein
VKGLNNVKIIMRRLALFFFLSVMLATAVHAEDITVTVSLDRNPISLDDQAVLTVSVSGENNASAPKLPDLPDFDVASSGRSTRISIVNGAMSSQVDYNFALQPKKAGDFTIGPVTVQFKGKTYQSSPVTIHVTKSAEAESGGKDLFVTTEVDRSSPFVGEQILFRLKFFRRINVANASLGDISFEGFQTADAGKETTYTANVDGIGYQVTEMRKLLIPSHAGTITIPEARLQCQVAAEGRQRTPGQLFGDDFFSFGLQRTTTKVLRSRPITLHVRSLPQEGKPPAFSGVVGAFTLSAELDKKEVRRGESVTLTMKVTGKGDLSGAPRPAIHGIEQFKAYDDQPVTSRNFVNGHMVSEKIFKTALVPLNAGDIKTPEVSFWYFDPDTGKYRKASAAMPRLHVLPADEREKSLVVEGQGTAAPKQSVQLVGKDILPIDTDIQALKDETFRPLAPEVLAVLLVPPLLFLGVLVAKRKRDKLAMDIGFARSTKAIKQARKGIDEAAVLAKGTDLKKCCAHLSKTFKTYLGDKLNRAGEAMTPVELKEALQTRISSHDPLVERIVALLQELERRQFAPGTYEPDATVKLVQEVQDLIQQMEKKL